MSGFLYTFVSQVPAEYICLICQCAMRKPVQTKCGHRFCKYCLQQSMRSRQECPVDREGLNESHATDIYPDVASERTILDFQVKCPNEKNGCEWIGELRSVEAHEKLCLFTRVTCSNDNCDVIILMKNLLNHLNNECSRRRRKCALCKESYVWCLQQDHFKECSRYPCTCVQFCGQNNIPRNEMNDHIAIVCPRTVVNCTFAHVGCQVKVQRNFLSEHVQANIESHLTLSCEKLQELQAEHEATKKQVKELQAKNVDTSPRNVRCNEFIWKFNRVEKRIRKAKDGKRTRFFSDSFHTGPYGYKMCVSIYPNGNGDGENTHLSVYMYLQRGDYDAILAWPFNQKVVVTLVDQQADQTKRKDEQGSMVPGDETDVSEYFVRPSSEQNDGFGFPTFISHDDLRTRRYLVDHTLFLQVKVEQDST